jgi:hypothetical protein
MRKLKQIGWCVYWLFDVRCTFPADTGYVGYTSDLKRRIRDHRKVFDAVGAGIHIMVLYWGTYEKCREAERLLRPKANIGWNKAIGGKPKVYLTEETHQKRAGAANKLWADPEARARRIIAFSFGQKRRLANPEARAKHRAALDAAQKRPEVRARKSAAMKKSWESPEIRAKRCAALSAAAKRRYENPEERIKSSAAQKRRFENEEPQDKAKRIAAQKRRFMRTEGAQDHAKARCQDA